MPDHNSYGSYGARKPHVKVEQEAYLALLATHPEGMLVEEVAEALEVHASTALRKLKGLEFQGKVSVTWHGPWKLASTVPPRYSPPTAAELAEAIRNAAAAREGPHEPITGGLITGTCPHCGGGL